MADTSKVGLRVMTTSDTSESELSDEDEANLSSDCLSIGDTASSIHDEMTTLADNAEKSNT